MNLRNVVLTLSALLFTAAAGAQTVTLTASNIKKADNTPFTGKLCFAPANNAGSVIPFQYGGGGQGVTQQVCHQVTGGVLQSGVTVPDTYVTNPQNLCLYATLIDPTQPPLKQVAATYACLQPASSGQSWCSTSGGVTTCNLDNYTPVVGALIVTQAGIPGPAGPAGPAGGGSSAGATDLATISGSDFGSKLASCLAGLNTTYGGICEARTLGYTSLASSSAITINTPNTVINLPCATITTTQQLVIAAGVRNVSIHGCGYQGGSNASGTAGGTVWVYTGTAAAIQVGDPTYAQDTKGFHIDNLNLNTASAGSAAVGLAFYRTQEIDVRSLYLNGNQTTGQTGFLLDGTGNYAGGTFDSNTLNGYGTGLSMTGHVSGSVMGDYANAGTFTRLHIVCPTSSGSPIAGTYGVSVAAGDGNTWNGGDIEGCATMFHLGAHAINNTILGLRNENSNAQYVADSGSSFNSVITGGTFFTGDITDAGSRNSFSDAFHRTINGINGDWYASQQDATIINHLRLGTGAGNVRGMQWETQVDNGTSATAYNWLWGTTDGGSGASNWIYQDLLNNVIRLQLQQNNTPGGSNGTAINAAGTGNVCFNCSGNAGTGGVAFSSGGATPTTVGTIDAAGNASFLGTLATAGVTTHNGSVTVKNQTNAEIDSTLWAGSTTAQKESFIYKDYTGASQWYMVNDAAANWALNSATGSIDAVKAYQSTNSGDLYLDSTNTGGTIRMNYETGSGTATNIYAGSSSALIASFTGTSIKFPGLAASSGHYCLQIDNSGFITNAGAACGAGGGGATGPTGPAGAAATIAVGTVTGGAAGSTPTVTNTGSSSAAVFAFAIPAGATGATGAAGATGSTGPTGPTGPTGATGAAGTGSGTVNSGTAGQIAAYSSTGTAVSGVAATGSGSVVLASNPTLITPALGAATATSVAASGALSGSQLSSNGSGGGQWQALEGTVPTGGTFAGYNWTYADSTAHRPMFNPNNAGWLHFMGIGTGGTAGHLCVFAASTYDCVDGGAVPTASSLGAASLSASTNTLANASASADYLVIQPGTGSTDQIGALEFANYAGTSQWEIRKDATNYWRLRDTANSADRVVEYPAGETIINAGSGSNLVGINNTSGSGTGGLTVYGGSTNYGVAEVVLGGNGNVQFGSASGSGNAVLGNHLNQIATGDYAGTCAMSAATSCGFSLQHSYTSAPICIATVQSSTVIAGGCTISGSTVTVTAASSNSATWGAVVIGNPN